MLTGSWQHRAAFLGSMCFSVPCCGSPLRGESPNFIYTLQPTLEFQFSMGTWQRGSSGPSHLVLLNTSSQHASGKVAGPNSQLSLNLDYGLLAVGPRPVHLLSAPCSVNNRSNHCSQFRQHSTELFNRGIPICALKTHFRKYHVSLFRNGRVECNSPCIPAHKLLEILTPASSALSRVVLCPREVRWQQSRGEGHTGRC